MTKEVWKSVIGYEDLYEISSFGRLRSKKDGRIKERTPNEDGYVKITLRKENGVETRFIHIFVAEAFLEKKAGCVINHIDGDKTNNRVENLEYVSRRENATHFFASRKPHTGASYCKKSNKWRSQISTDGKRKWLGDFSTPEEASAAYRGALRALDLENKYAR